MDLSYVGPRLIAMGFPSEGIEASCSRFQKNNQGFARDSPGILLLLREEEGWDCVKSPNSNLLLREEEESRANPGRIPDYIILKSTVFRVSA